MNHLSKTLIILGVVSLAVGCKSKDETPSTPTPPTTTNEYMHVGYGIGYEGEAEGYLLPQTREQLQSGAITFIGSGYKLEKNARTHRFYTANQGAYVYNLEYGNATLAKFRNLGARPYYEEIGTARKDIRTAIDATHPRWTVLSDDTALVYDPKITKLQDVSGAFAGMSVSVRFLKVDLSGNMTVNPPVDVVLPAETETEVPNLHVWRVDSPIVVDGKLYIGVSKRGYDGVKSNISTNNYAASTLVVDYPSFTNPRILRSELGRGQGYGFRTPAYISVGSDVYHTTMDNSRILRIRGGAYDNSYDFDLARALGMERVGGSGIFYAGNGIAYVPFYDATKGSGVQAKAWGVARVDLNARTAIKLNLSEGLWLWYYQSAKLGADGKLYMALCPVGSETGNIYIFDPANTTPNGFIKGASLAVTGEGFYMGVF